MSDLLDNFCHLGLDVSFGGSNILLKIQYGEGSYVCVLNTAVVLYYKSGAEENTSNCWGCMGAMFQDRYDIYTHTHLLRPLWGEWSFKAYCLHWP